LTNAPLYPSLPTPQITRYQRWLERERGLHFESYAALWQWSVDELESFWQSLWDYFSIDSPTPYDTVLRERCMPGAVWFPGVRLNYAQHVLAAARGGNPSAQPEAHPAIVFANEAMLARGELQHIGWGELRQQVANFAAALQGMGVQPGDRVVAFMPNVPQTVLAFLACASIGAVWSLCAPDMGPVAVLDRFRQIEPKVLIACDGVHWAGSRHDKRALVQHLADALPSLQHLVLWQQLLPGSELSTFTKPGLAAHDFDRLTQGHAVFAPAWLPFDHPLWIVYSSGTTGLPKAIVHGHGGVMLESLKGHVLHNNVGPSVDTGDRFFWYSSTAWIMWNAGLAALLAGSSLCIFDGSAAGPSTAASPAPDWGTLWRFAALSRCTFFGAGAAFYASCLKAEVKPQQQGDLSALRYVGSTGSPLSDEAYRWIWAECPRIDGQPIWLNPISGGTDFCGAFVAGNITLPVHLGEMQCRCLGAGVQAFNEAGQAVTDEVGELVCTTPLPSMPLYFWGDAGGERLRESYFEMFPGVWRHGDWIRITPRGGAIIYGRSDATLNRQGIRMGTAELYGAVEALPEVLDSLVVDLEYLGRPSEMLLFVVLREGQALTPELTQRLKSCIRNALSPRHVPDAVHAVPAVPRTLSGKKMELPVKKLLLGGDPAKLMNRDAMANAASVDWFLSFVQSRLRLAGR
jgi:acetoacetyl-CoA synthetase